jgi:hypothetical protein
MMNRRSDGECERFWTSQALCQIAQTLLMNERIIFYSKSRLIAACAPNHGIGR